MATTHPPPPPPPPPPPLLLLFSVNNLTRYTCTNESKRRSRIDYEVLQEEVRQVRVLRLTIFRVIHTSKEKRYANLDWCHFCNKPLGFNSPGDQISRCHDSLDRLEWSKMHITQILLQSVLVVARSHKVKQHIV